MLGRLALFSAKIAFALTSTLTGPRRGLASLKSSSVYIALGSNLGDRCSAIHAAIQLLKQIGSIHSTSFLYESIPMYESDQPRFLNAAIRLETNLSPQALLTSLQSIEKKVGRTLSYRNGPRLLDLDILLYLEAGEHYRSVDVSIENSGENNLQIPHPRIRERAFVLQPLVDLNPQLLIGEKSANVLLQELQCKEKNSLQRVMPLGISASGEVRLVPVTSDGKFGSALVQGILNITPDSFSDGGAHCSTLDSAVGAGIQMIRDGADVVDVGGESTRPNSEPVSQAEEEARVVPVVSALVARCRRDGLPICISIDTRNAKTAEAAVAAGACIINDVSGGRHDLDMIAAAGRLMVPLILMHSRGNPQTMSQATNQMYRNLVHEVADELLLQIRNHADSQLPRWLQIVDPGIGFAKGTNDCLELLKPESINLFKRRLEGRAVLIGASRKRFLQTESDDVPRDRDWATVGVHALAIVGGADMVRVHNVAAARQSIDALIRVLRAGETK